MPLYWIWFSMVSELTLQQKLTLLQRIPDPEDIYKANTLPDGIELDKDLSAAEAVARKCIQKSIGVLPFSAPEFPARLRNIPDPPLILYYRGVLPDLSERPAIGVVGTRKATGYGLHQAELISEQLVQQGAVVVSGGADGVDTAALSSAIKAGGATVAVLGSGVDVVYPRTNRRLFTDILENGCLISEYQPGAAPISWHFPARNRIISGISNGVLVVEAPKKSGALLTSDYALEQGRDVFAVPGNVDSPMSRGSNALLQNGAMAVLSGWDILREYQASYPKTVKMQPVKTDPAVTKPASDKKSVDNSRNNPYSVGEKVKYDATAQEQALLDCLSRVPKPVDAVVAETGMPAAQVLSMLTMLALKGIVINHPGKLVSLK